MPFIFPRYLIRQQRWVEVILVSSPTKSISDLNDLSCSKLIKLCTKIFPEIVEGNVQTFVSNVPDCCAVLFVLYNFIFGSAGPRSLIISRSESPQFQRTKIKTVCTAFPVSLATKLSVFAPFG